jgi:hypothetical protein
MGNNGMGLGMRPFGRRRFRNPSAMRLRQGLQAPKDQLATESLIINKFVDTAVKQDEILSNFDSFLKLAGSELGSLRNVAKNITQSGKEVNLWEILAAVNETVRKSPDSSISQLMAKFEVSIFSCKHAIDIYHFIFRTNTCLRGPWIPLTPQKLCMNAHFPPFCFCLWGYSY